MHEYLVSIGIREPIEQRVNEILNKINALFSNIEILDVAVNDYIKEDMTRIYDSIRFYSKDFTIRVNGLTEPEYHFIIAPSIKDIDLIKIESKNFDFIKANEKSRLMITAQYPNRIINDLKGSGTNCDHLMEIYRKYILPFAKKP
jgi:hypothetical protein